MRRLVVLVAFSVSLVACGGSTNDQTSSTSGSSGGSGGSSQGGSSSVGGTSSQGGTSAGGTTSEGGAGGSQGGSSQAGTSSEGGVGGSLGGSGGTTSEGGTGGMTSQSLEGSYTFVFTNVSLASQNPPLMPVSVGQDTRLDIRKNASGGYDALFTQDFRQTGALTGQIVGDALVLDGTATIVGNSNVGYQSEQWTELRLGLNPVGGFTFVASATGMAIATSGDEEFNSDATGTAKFSYDLVAPSLKATFGDPAGPPNAMLPWDPIVVATSEGVDMGSLASHVSATFGDGEPPPMVTYAISPDASDPTAWGGARSSTLHLASFSPMPNDVLQVNALPGIPDRVGNVSAMFDASSPVVSPGNALTVHAFEGDVVQEAAWGPTMFLGSKSGSDPRCENGGSCVMLGPTGDSNSPCAAFTPTGLAGLLDASVGGAILVRYKVTTKGFGDGSPPNLYVPPFEVLLATRDGKQTVTSVMLQPSDFADQGAAAGDERWATTWTTMSLQAEAMPPGAEVGFELRVPYFDACGGGLGPPQSPTRVYFESISMQP